MNEQQRLEAARRRVATLLSVGDAVGHVDPASLRAAAFVRLSPTAERFATALARFVLANVELLAVILAGSADDKVLAGLLADLDVHVPRPDPLYAYLMGLGITTGQAPAAPSADTPGTEGDRG